MIIFAIDPGPNNSAYCLLEEGTAIVDKGIVANDELRSLVIASAAENTSDVLVIEQIRGFGLTAGNETFDTCMWTGRFCEVYGPEYTYWLPRKTVVTHLCNTAKAGDKHVRQALIERFGGATAIGKKKAPGPLYGITGDVWSALAVAVTFYDRRAFETLRKGA